MKTIGKQFKMISSLATVLKSESDVPSAILFVTQSNDIVAIKKG
jgi:hypothetical protein